MSESTTLHVVTVFLGEGDTGGNPLGVFLGAPGLDAGTRQRIAADLGFSETVFVEDRGTGALCIHTPAVELPLAGHPLVGTSWLLRREGAGVDTLRPSAGDVATWAEGEHTWIRADPRWAPEFDTRRLASPADVDALTGGEKGVDLHAWAWEDEPAGRVRVRVFPDEMGIGEDEATGAAALRLGALLGRPLVIRQGVGSRIDVRPGPDGTIEVGGRCALLETREYPLD
ncbi:putative PhzF superfamily epimerase YddE/YHI9 [Spinactinospora alkalitolerans]|uniref:Putative PhzF superfamily epimerase YddE/YHI9 n=1 Tax=Spinactinospora alkalitolerans TaxID=687207 RepID=A0A852U4B3_9ACTN|nr:PhzF family phenazine biosynthesis protein [Spinactinospora alkalitolerans]NYE48934.1 putative PhzF superfamily epimerase YddE/YHI9 [Spinactinospora alkalitolerans]